MGRPFLITGLPRSRSAWFAALCNTVPDAICYHEPLIKLERWQSIETLLRNQGTAFTGAADHALGFHLPELIAMLDPLVLIVTRPREEVEASLAALFPKAPQSRYLEVLERRLDAVPSSDRVKRVAFAELARLGTTFACVRHLMPGAEPSHRKLMELHWMNVQADLPHAMNVGQIAAKAGRMPHVLGADVMAELEGKPGEAL